jgi:hypothetical protein
VGFIRQDERAQHIELRTFGAGRFALVLGFVGTRRREQIGIEGLKLDRIAAGIGGDIDESLGEVELSVVIDACLGDDKRRLADADLAARDAAQSVGSSISRLASWSIAIATVPGGNSDFVRAIVSVFVT